MNAFVSIAIRVDLQNAGHSILMAPNYSRNHVVVYADPKKLSPFMDRFNRWESPASLASKHAEVKAVLLAARTEILGERKIISPDNIVLTMAEAMYCEEGYERKRFLRSSVIYMVPVVGFSNGITRTTELIAQGANFVPLETSVMSAEKLHALVGGDRKPEPVEDFRVSEAAEEAAFRRYVDRRMAGGLDI